MNIKFRDETTGNFYTQGLFLELSYGDLRNAVYTLKDFDYEFKGKTYISIKRLYLEIGDPTEYEFAQACFEGWSHWKRICTTTTALHPYIEEWREELEVKLRSDGIKGVVNEVKAQGKGALQASKWLADKGWTEKRGAGRPTKAEVESERKQRARIAESVGDDLDRITQH